MTHDDWNATLGRTAEHAAILMLARRALERFAEPISAMTTEIDWGEAGPERPVETSLEERRGER